MNHQPRLRSIFSLVVGVGFVALAIAVFMQRDFIADSIRAYQFTPDAAVASMPAETGMSERGKLLFMASHPKLDDTQQFNTVCENTEKNSMVLGCYFDRTIYLYNVDNKEIAGIEEVTAAHEMLHAAYDRLSASERAAISEPLLAKAEELKSVDEFQARMKAYESLSAEDQLNELHSILATEVRDLPDELESYYAKYFTDRSKTVALYEQYADVFRQLQNETEQLAKSLDALAVEINTRGEAYTQATQQLARDISGFNQRAQSGEFNSEYEFNAERGALVMRSQQLDIEYRSLQGMIASYDSQKRRYDAVATHLHELTNSLDSSLAPVPEV